MKISSEGLSLHSNMIVVDAHSDSISKCLIKNSYPELKSYFQGGINLQVFALYTPLEFIRDASLFTLETISLFNRWKDKEGVVVKTVLSKEDLRLPQDGKLLCLLSIEGGEALEGKLFMLDIYYNLGVRAMGLTWNTRNQLADGQGACKNPGGLTCLGEKVVKRMNELGMVIDVSHIAEKGFWEVVKLADGPVIASHSNCYSLCSHPRNLKDDQIVSIMKTGGVVGVTFVPSFLTNEKAGINDVISHIEYIVKITDSYDYVGIGSDFDGTDEYPSGLESVTSMPVITDVLLQRGHRPEDVEKIMGLNWLRVFSKVLH